MMAVIAFAFAVAASSVCGILVGSSLYIRLASLRRSARRLTLEEILRDRTLAASLFVGIAIIASWAVDIRMCVVLLPVALIAARKAPAYLDKRAKERLKAACEDELDAMVDMVSLGVSAGLSFDAALALYYDHFDNELAGLMREAHVRWSCGLASRERTLSDVSAHLGSPPITRFTDTVVQALRRGTMLAPMLTRLATDLRRDQRAEVERRVSKAPVKMLIPTGTCILPAMLILVMGPVILQFMSSGI